MTVESSSPWRSRIVRHADVAPGELAAHPANFRRHPQSQADAVSGALGTVGWVQDVIVNDRTGRVVDGSGGGQLKRHLPVLDQIVTGKAECHEIRKVVGALPIAVEGPRRDDVMDVQISAARGNRMAVAAATRIAFDRGSTAALPVRCILAFPADTARIRRVVRPHDVKRSACWIAVEMLVRLDLGREHLQWRRATRAGDGHAQLRGIAVRCAKALQGAEDSVPRFPARLDPEHRAALVASQSFLGQQDTLDTATSCATDDESEAIDPPSGDPDGRGAGGAHRVNHLAGAAVTLFVPLLLPVGPQGHGRTAPACAKQFTHTRDYKRPDMARNR